MTEHIVFGDWRDLRGAIERAAPDWASSAEETRQMLWDFAQAVVAEYAPMKAACLHCKEVMSIRQTYRCADCHAHLCLPCIREHFEESKRFARDSRLKPLVETPESGSIACDESDGAAEQQSPTPPLGDNHD